MNRDIIKYLLFSVFLVLIGCRNDSLTNPVKEREKIEKKLAVILPFDNGLEKYWRQTAELFATNLPKAFVNQQREVVLNIEWYDESAENLAELGKRLADRSDLYAVIGGLYSKNANQLASSLCRYSIPFFTIATTDQLVRGYASTGNLWAMTETDITQCEVLLSKVVNYGGKTVALIADEEDPYGKTFVDWFAFQAKELGLEVKGLFNGSDMVEEARKAARSQADYTICAPSDPADIEKIVDTFNEAGKEGITTPRILLSDTGYGSDVLELLGEKIEGLEGVCFGSNPESGFDVSYNIYFGNEPTVGASQFYDALMLTAYSVWLTELNPNLSIRNSLREIVDGREFNMGSWMGEDMRNVVDALAKGGKPYVRGASGELNFDSKVYTNVLATTYYNYKVYEGKYIILDYNTAEGGNRTDATLAGWNWKASGMQDFEDEDSGVLYAEHLNNRALLIAASSGWSNYRHQADVFAMYQLLKQNGYSDDEIILIAEDDIAYNHSNPDQGVIRVKPGGENLHTDIVVDYKLSELNPDDFFNILAGDKTATTPAVIDSDEHTNLFVFWSGHGAPENLVWNETYGIPGNYVFRTLSRMAEEKRYRKLAFFTETCFAGSVFEKCTGLPGMIFFTATNPSETSKADVFNVDLGVWMSNRFTSTMLETVESNPEISLHDLYNRLFINTVGSHVMVYNDRLYGNLYNNSVGEFLKAKGD